MKLSEHFTLAEFERSATARKLGIDNTAPEKYWANMKRLCTKVLEPLRASFAGEGAPTPYVTIHSGFRCYALNTAVGGVRTSHHRIGCAADITIAGHTPTEVFQQLIKLNGHLDPRSKVPVTQVILYNTFVHVSYTGWNKGKFIINQNK